MPPREWPMAKAQYGAVFGERLIKQWQRNVQPPALIPKSLRSRRGAHFDRRGRSSPL